MADKPWFKFHPKAWRSDQALRVCSLAARGLWIEMLCVMHSAAPYGHLIINGSPVSDSQLAMLAGTSPDQIPGLLGELESAGVFSRTQKGVIYSRRMTRDDKAARLARKNGLQGGNPALCNQRQNPPPDNPPPNPDLKLRDSEVRDKKESPPSPPRPNGAGGGGEFDQFWLAYPSRGEEPNPPKPARAEFDRLVAGGVDPAALIAGAAGYAEHCRRTGRLGGRYVAKACNFLADGAYEHFAAKPRAVPDAVPPEEWRKRMTAWAERGRRLWPKAYGAPPGEPDCWVPVEILAEFLKEPAA